MIDEITDSDDYHKFRKNKVSFITFNYDRSLEYFLHDSLVNFFYEKRHEIDFTDLLNSIPILHIYGKIADLPWQSRKGFEYKSKDLIKNMEELVLNIRIINEKSNEDLKKIKELICSAKRIFFLGFGFAKENMDILGIPEILKHEPQIFGTAFRWTAKEILEKRKYLVSSFKIKDPRLNNPYILDLNCYDLLREYL